MFCNNCGKPVLEVAKFCKYCGQSLDGERQSPEQTPPAVQYDRAAVYSDIRPGFSDRINHPSFRAVMQRTARGTGVFAFLLIIAPIVIAFVLGIKDGNFSYMGIGAVISVFFLIFNLISAASKKAKSNRTARLSTVRHARPAGRTGRIRTIYTIPNTSLFSVTSREKRKN